MSKQRMWRKGAKRTSGVLWRYFTATCYTREYHKKALDLDIGFADVKIVDHQTFFLESEWKTMEDVFRQKILKDPGYFKEYESACIKHCKKHIENSERIAETNNLSDKNNDELKKLFESYMERRCLVGVFLNTIWMVNDILNEELSKRIPDDTDTIISELVYPSKESDFVKKEKSLLEIGALIQENKIKENEYASNKKLNEKIRKYLCDYGWTNINQFFGDALNEEDVYSELKDVLTQDCKKRLEEIPRLSKTRKDNALQLMKTINPDSVFNDLVETARRYLFLETYHIDALNYSDYLIRGLLEEVAARMGLKYNELLYASHQEILDCLETGGVPEPSEVCERMKAYAILNLGGKVEILSGEKLEEYLEGEGEECGVAYEVKGIVANKGKARGRVKIICDITEMDKMKQGDILVSPMTHPNLTIAVKKAAAIVTDEGGLSCHAAIMSRELNIPCVIGTKNATKVFKDGDFVEVDAAAGVVRKL